MPTRMKIVIVAALLAIVSGVLVLKSGQTSSRLPAAPTAMTGAGLPRIVCLGAGACIPCKAMEPVREELRHEYAGRLAVDFHDVWKNPDVARDFGIRLIPTTIFYDAAGKELTRGEGFMSKQDIVAKFLELGVSF